eukprot:CAMPEP_0194044214 /NCGR_PEP_ID=MMETSP0009_2-20130614/15713_1 /TAXON_ID=210454 /ORGANISM="Grammatophora oceanica, Strain CCMP 410" /LENGTH=155 /DNA_ID=CAMNT_0038688667 /DNA_START=93 /DNA_END=560 /DNA_ORIENTATION=-
MRPSTKSFTLSLLVVLCLVVSGAAFAPQSLTKGVKKQPSTTNEILPQATPTQLSERRWNFNDFRSPWGVKRNAEIWNGRIAQIAFVITFLQELIQGKGVIQGIQEGDPINLAMLGLAVVSTVGFTAFLASKGIHQVADIRDESTWTLENFYNRLS